MQVKRHFEIKKFQNHTLSLGLKPWYYLILKCYNVFNPHSFWINRLPGRFLSKFEMGNITSFI